MVNRNHVRCHACGNALAIRITVGGGLQRFVFPCPYCSAQLAGSFYAEQPTAPFGPDNPPKPFELKSEDFDVLTFSADREGPEMLAVAVDTDLPVHVSLLATPITAPWRSPFIEFVRLAGFGDATGELVERINVLRQMRFALLPSVRRAAAFYATGDMTALERELQRVPGFAELGIESAPPWSAFNRVMQGFFRVIGTDAARRAARNELRETLERALTADAQMTRDFISQFNARALSEHRRRVLDTVVRSLEDHGALIAGMSVEALRDLDLNSYRIQRSDFDDLKSRYQDMFELGSRTIVVPASLYNISMRGDARAYSDGERRRLREALTVKAETREGWLAELPAAKTLYDDSARKTRNLIGHRLISYDYQSAALIDDKGQAHNFLFFMRDYLGSVRCCAYILDVVDLMTTFEQLAPGTGEA